MTKPESAGRPPRCILLVEPSESECVRLRDELEASGLEVQTCAGPAEAAAAASDAPPGLILARWGPPPGIGLDLLRRLREHTETDGVPVILHGGGATEEERIAALELGALDVMPTTPGAAELVAQLLRRAAATRADG